MRRPIVPLSLQGVHHQRRRSFGHHLIAILTMGLATVIFAAGVANADEESTGDRAYAECISRQYDNAALNELMEQGVIDKDDYDGNAMSPNSDDEWVQEQKEKHSEEFERLHDHYENDQSLGGKAGRLTNSGVCQVSKPVDTVVKTVQESEFWDGPLGQFVDAAVSGNTQALQQVMTLWLDFSISGEEVEGLAEGVTNTVWVIAFSVFIISLVIIGARMAALRRQGIADGLEDLGSFYGRFLIIGIVVPLIVAPSLVATDQITSQILTLLPKGESLSDAIDSTIPGKDVFEPALLLIPILFSLAGTVTQMLALAARVLILPILVGLLPVSAAFGGSETGRMSSKSMLSWIAAAIAFKPLSALLYVAAFRIASGESIEGADGMIGAIMKLLILGIAGFSPLLVIKIISPMLANVSGQNSAATAGAVAAGVGGVAAVALGGGAAVAGGAGKALGGSAIGGGGKGGGAGGSSGTGGNSTPPPPDSNGTGGSGGSGGPTGGGDSGSGSAGQAQGGNPAAATSGGGESKNTSSQPGGGSGGSGEPKGRLQRVGAAAGRGRRGAGSGLQRAGGGLKVLQKAASNAGRSAGAGLSRTGQMMDDIGK